MATKHPLLIPKICRPYVSSTLTIDERVSALVDHYLFMQRMGWAYLVSDATAAPVPIIELEAKAGTAYRIMLRTGETMEHEGDLVFQLLRGEICIASCAFSFFPISCNQLAIGGAPSYGRYYPSRTS